MFNGILDLYSNNACVYVLNSFIYYNQNIEMTLCLIVYLGVDPRITSGYSTIVKN